MNWKKSFRDIYCAKFDCDPSQYESAVLRIGLHRRSLPIAWLIRLFRPAFFELELRTVRYLGNATSSGEFRAELDSYRSRYRRHGGLLRNAFAVRLSGSRLLRLLVETTGAELPPQPSHPPTPPP